ncbi:CsbD family protein [Streptomyces globisporus]|uniref:CsbD family protein n=1 Tax=Streptomyces globisporus TaxID=1908 RepID=UPI00099B6474|nr:CsbD family protein [Streptomyces globisporus]
MSGGEKARTKGGRTEGVLKEAAGRAAGAERMAAEGHAEKARGDAREAKGRTKGVFKG